jgi:hypothetical protein
MEKTHVQRLKELGQKIINTGGYCGRSRYKTLCEQVGLMMIQPVTTELQEYKNNVTFFVRTNIHLSIDAKRDIIYKEIEKILPDVKEKIKINDPDDIFNKIDTFSDDKYEALFILHKIMINLDDKYTDKNNEEFLQVITFFREEILKLFIIICNDINTQQIFEQQYGGGKLACAILIAATAASIFGAVVTMGAASILAVIALSLALVVCAYALKRND